MESTVSVSKGVFVFANGFNIAKRNKKKSGQMLFEKLFRNDLWHTSYKRNWDLIDNVLKEINHKTYTKLMNDIVAYIKSSYTDDETLMKGVIPSVTLLTGVSQSDHVSQFSAIINIIREEVTSHVALVSSHDAPSVKHLLEHAVRQLIKGQYALDTTQEEFTTPKPKKKHCPMKTLESWYHNYSTSSPNLDTNQLLVIIIPDFESFDCNVLQDFVMLVSSYVPSLPIVLVFGVATSVSAIHKSFSYIVSSKLLIQVFHSHSSPVYMNQVLEDVFLNYISPFHLSGKSLELLTDVFLFYDFSVTRLIQSIKYCMMEHYYGDNIRSLCCQREQIEEALQNLNRRELESIRQLLSFRPYLEKQDAKTKIDLFENDSFFRVALQKELNRLHDYVYSFYLCVRLLCEFVKDLPKNVMGKTVRGIYTKCAAQNITATEAFKESMQLIGFQSQMKLAESIENALKVINSYLQIASPIKPLRSSPIKNNMRYLQMTDELGEHFVKSTRVYLKIFLTQIEHANTESTVLVNDSKADKYLENVLGNRHELKEKLYRATKAHKIQSQFEMVRARFVSYLEEMFCKGLQPPHTQPFYELLFFSDVSNVKKLIVGSPRGSLHTALSNPAHYLQCTCCKLPSPDSIVPALPDICLAYKLHRECGKHINLYDWLQAFAAVLRPDDDDEMRHHDPVLQLRFKRAIAELQFLGFIKSSKRKTDHVMRLTW